MVAVWTWLLSLLSSFAMLIYSAPPPPPLPPDVVIVQEYGDTPEVAGAVTNFPLSDLKRSAERVDTWTPPVTDELTAESIMIMDKSSGKVLWSRNPEIQWPTASITKLMSSIVFMDKVASDASVWDKSYTMTEADEEDGTIYIYRGEEIKVEDLFALSLVGSVNSATRALFHAVGVSDEVAVERMNKKARSFGLWHTEFYDVTGLNQNNSITAKESAWLMKEALEYTKIQEALLKSSYSFTLSNGRDVSVITTNKLLDKKLFVEKEDFLEQLYIEGGKTGHIIESRYNFAVSIRNDMGDAVIVVVLGTAESDLRFSEASELALWAHTNYRWK